MAKSILTQLFTLVNQGQTPTSHFIFPRKKTDDPGSTPAPVALGNSKICYNCGTTNPEGLKYCVACSHILTYRQDAILVTANGSLWGVI